jgi:two-component system, NarL family, sensor kinase
VSLLLFGITWMLTRSRTQAFRASADLKVANTELQSSTESLVSAREEERRRLRRDLHDGVGPQLAALMLELEIASDHAGMGHDEVCSRFGTLAAPGSSRRRVSPSRREVRLSQPPLVFLQALL